MKPTQIKMASPFSGRTDKIINYWKNGPLVDWQIQHLIQHYDMIAPAVDGKISKLVNGYKLPSRGQSCAGYDFTVMSNYQRIQNAMKKVMLGKSPILNDEAYLNDDGIMVIDLPRYGHINVFTREYFKIPPFIRVDCHGKSTLAREGIDVLVTPLENGWEGHLTVELTSHNPNTVMIPVDGGWGQLVFYKTEIPAKDYSQDGGRYHMQQSGQGAIVE